MATAAFASTTGGGAVNFGDGNTMTYGTQGNFLVDFLLGTPKWEIVPETAPGVDGAGSSNYGYRGWKIKLHVCYIGGGEADICQKSASDMENLGGGLSNLTVAGQTFQACELLSFEPIDRQPRPTGLGTFQQHFNIQVDSWRNS
jgi:hypothetical protein